MKTVSLIISVFMMLFTLSVNAQSDEQRQQRGPRQMINPEQMVKRQVEQMKTELKLNETQEKQVTELLIANFKKRGETFQKFQGQRDSIMFYSKKFNEEQKLSLKKILTEEQYKTYVANQEKKRKEMEQRQKEWEQRRGEGNMRGPHHD